MPAPQALETCCAHGAPKAEGFLGPITWELGALETRGKEQGRPQEGVLRVGLEEPRLAEQGGGSGPSVGLFV